MRLKILLYGRVLPEFSPKCSVFLSSLIFECLANLTKLKISMETPILSVKCSEFTSSCNQITRNR